MDLIICEKINEAQNFAYALGAQKGSYGFSNSEAIIVPLDGHVAHLYEPHEYDPNLKRWNLTTLPIIPDHFLYELSQKYKKIISAVNQVIKKRPITRIVIATDCGREGELIGRTALQFIDTANIPVVRFWTWQALDRKTIIEGLHVAKPIADYDFLYNQGLARQQSDWLVGMNFTRAISLSLNRPKTTFQVGRVKTAVLSLIYEREKEIYQFVPEIFTKIRARFQCAAGWFDGLLYLDNNETKITDIEYAQTIVDKVISRVGMVESVSTSRKRTMPDRLFNTLDVQKQAAAKWGYSPKFTHDILQSLYMRLKVISYPRTESRNLPTGIVEQIRQIISTFSHVYPDLVEHVVPERVDSVNQRVFDDSRLGDHPAIIPTAALPDRANHHEHRVYHLILKRFIAAFCGNYIYDETEVVTSIDTYRFRSRVNIPVAQGYKALYSENEQSSSIPEKKELRFQEADLTSLQANDEAVAVRVWRNDDATQPPKLYTNETLLSAMEKPAIGAKFTLGTSATRHEIIERLFLDKYLELDGKYLLVTEKGAELIFTLKRHPTLSPLINPGETGRWEQSLESNPNDFLMKIREYTREAVDYIKTEGLLTKSLEDEPAVTQHAEEEIGIAHERQERS
jgi:DNA topoisomerase-3